MMKGFNADLNIGVYDGDTSQSDRILLRDNARLVIYEGRFLSLLLPSLNVSLKTKFLLKCSVLIQLITNPDMLHLSILPQHRQFSRILSNLR